MTTPPDPSIALVPVSETVSALALPDIVRRAGQAAVLPAEEFFYGADSAETQLERGNWMSWSRPGRNRFQVCPGP